MIREETNELFDNLSEYSVIIHQCNTKGQYCSKIAQQLFKKYPSAFNDYYTYCQWHPGEHESKIVGTWARTRVSPKLIVCNAIVQRTVGKNKSAVDLDAWDAVCQKLFRQTKYVNKKTGHKWTIHAPSNICTRSFGIDSDDVKDVFKKYFKDSDVDVVFHKY